MNPLNQNETFKNILFKKSLKDKTDSLYNKMNTKKSTPFNCCKCGKGSYTQTCVSCMKKKADNVVKVEFSENLSTNNNKRMKIEDILKIKCKKYGKEPFKSIPWTQPKFQSKNYKPNPAYNVGIVCSPNSGVFGVDLDFYTKTYKDGTVSVFDPENNEKHGLFYKIFGEDFISKFDTFTQKTPSGGIHLLFQHEEGLVQTENSEYKVDTRGGNTNGYVVGFDSEVKGKKYQIINNTDIKPIPKELKDFLQKYIFKKNSVSKKPVISKRGEKTVSAVPNRDLEVVYSYDISDCYLRDILDNIPKTYYQDFTYWFIFTSAMKQLGRFELWEEYSKKGSNYDSNENLKYWDSVKNRAEKGVFYFEHLAKQAGKSEYINYIKYKAVPKNKTVPDKVVELEKLGYGMEITTDRDMIIKSDTGTGKTTLFKNFIKKSGNNFISIVSRRSLAMEQYNDFLEISENVLYYEHEKHPLRNAGNMVICIDSLAKIQSWDFDDYVIFLDEFDSIIKYLLTSPTLADRRTELFLLLVNDIFMNAKSIIMADADISDITHKFIRYIKKFREQRENEREFIYIQNKYIHNRNTPSTEYFSFEKLITKAKKTDKYLFATDSKEQAINLYKKLHTEEKPVLLLIAEDNINKQSEKFPKLSDHERIIFSPKIIYGLDSDGFGIEKEPRPVFAYYKEHTISPSNMLQQINRERRITELHYMFEKKSFIESDYQKLDDMKEDIIEDNLNALKYFELEDDEINKMFVDLLIDYTYILDCYNSNKYTHFKVLLKERGFVDSHTKRGKNKGDKKKLMKEKKKNVKDYKLEVWDTADALNSRLNEDTLKIFNTTEIYRNRNLFLDAGAVDKYLLTKKLYIDSDTKTANKLAEDKDFAIMKVKNASNKIEFIKSLEKDLGIDKYLNIENENQEVSADKVKEINDKYRKIFGSRNKVEFELSNDYKKKQFVAGLLKNVFGKDFLKKKKTRVGQKTITEVNVDMKKIEEATAIYQLSKKPKIKNITLRNHYNVDMDPFEEDTVSENRFEVMEELIEKF